MINNKIKIPWYKRSIKGVEAIDDMGNNPISFSLPNIPKPKTRTRIRVRQPVRVPVKAPVTSPVTSPILEPNPFLEPLPLPDKFPVPIPFPERNPEKNPYREPTIPQLPTIPAFINNPTYDWAKHWETVANNLPQKDSLPNTPEPKMNPFVKTLEIALKPAIYLFLARETVNNYVKINITDPVYNEMLNDPVLGSVLREAQKANLDTQMLGTILGNFDWENGDYKDLEKALITGIGVAGASRLMVFIVGRKVLFRM